MLVCRSIFVSFLIVAVGKHEGSKEYNSVVSVLLYLAIACSKVKLIAYYISRKYLHICLVLSAAIHATATGIRTMLVRRTSFFLSSSSVLLLFLSFSFASRKACDSPNRAHFYYEFGWLSLDADTHTHKPTFYFCIFSGIQIQKIPFQLKHSQNTICISHNRQSASDAIR